MLNSAAHSARSEWPVPLYLVAPLRDLVGQAANPAQPYPDRLAALGSFRLLVHGFGSAA